MSRLQPVRHVGAVILAGAHLVVVVTPAAALALAADKGGLPEAHGLDLLGASIVVGGAHAAVIWRRLLGEIRRTGRRIDAFIAAFDGLVVLALLATLLLYFVLGAFAPEHAAIVNNGWPVFTVWVAVQVVAVLLAEAVHLSVFDWLGRDRSRTATTTAGD